MGLPNGVPDIGKTEGYKPVPDSDSNSPSHEAKLTREGNPPVLSFEIPAKYENPGEVPIAGHENPGSPEKHESWEAVDKAKNLKGV
jgi:hypothetical protein